MLGLAGFDDPPVGFDGSTPSNPPASTGSGGASCALITHLPTFLSVTAVIFPGVSLFITTKKSSLFSTSVSENVLTSIVFSVSPLTKPTIPSVSS